MSRHQVKEKQEVREATVRQRMARFQSGAPQTERGGSQGRSSRRSAAAASKSKQDIWTPGAASVPTQAPPSHLHDTPPSPYPDTELHPYVCPSYCDTFFSSLCRLREEGLLLDCKLNLYGNSIKSHRLVLSGVSQTAQTWLNSSQTGLKEVELKELEGAGSHVTPLGLRAIVHFAYYGETDVACGVGGLQEVMDACRCLGAERLAEVCGAKAPPSAAGEREKSLQIIRGLWERQVGCDVTIQAESGERFPAHRVVLSAGGDYFRALLCGGLRESVEEVVCLRGVAAWALRALLGFVYSGLLPLGWSNVWDLTEAVLQFQLQGALSLCLRFLQENMDAGTCLDTLALAEAYGLVDLGQATEDYILAHFQSVSAGGKFRDLPCSVLERLLERDSLCVESEMEVFRAVVRWVEEDEEQRQGCLARLLGRVRLPLLSPVELREVQGWALLRQAGGAVPPLATVRHLLEGGQISPPCTPRTPNQVLVLVGGDCVDEELTHREPNRGVWFAQGFRRGPGLVRTVEWRQLAQLPEPPRFRHSVCVLKNKLYVLGGRKYYGALDILKSALRLAHPLDTPLCGHAAAVMDNKTFVSGGCDSHFHCFSSLWLYDPSQGCSSLVPMATGAGRAGHVMLVLGNQLIVAGGLQPLVVGFGDQLQCEAYDPYHNRWTRLPILPRPHLSSAATSLDGQLYVLGGSSADSARDTPWVHRYNPRRQHWERLGAMPRPYADLAACTLQLPASLRL